MTLRNISVTLLAAAAVSAFAAVNPDYDYEILTTASGDMLYGYPMAHNSDGSMIFKSVAARRHIVSDSVTSVFSKTISRENLPEEIAEGLRLFPTFAKNAGTEDLRIGQCTLPGKWGGEFIVEREGSDGFHILTFEEAVDTLSYEMIARRASRVAPKDQDYGLLDKVTTPRRVYSGKIIERVPSKHILIWINGAGQEIPMDNVNILEKIAVDTSASVVSQSPFLTTFYFDDGSTLSGIELMTDYLTGDLDVMSASDDKIYRKNLDNVVRRENTVNPAYPPVRAPKLDYSDGKIYADTTLISELKPKQIKGDKVDLNSEQMLKETATVVSRNDKGGLGFSHKSDLKNVLTLYRVSEPESARSFKKSELIGGIAPSSIEKNRDGRTSIDFESIDQGIYILSFLGDNRYYVLDIR